MDTEEQNDNINRSRRVLLLCDINSSHTQKWAFSLAAKGIQVGLFSVHKKQSDWYKDKRNILLLYSPAKEENVQSVPSQAQFALALPALKKAINRFKPDILHAHYASTYGFLGALSGFHPFIISVWGNDIFNFPKNGIINKLILKFTLKRADRICSPSLWLKKETEKYTHNEIAVIPFGVDLTVFKPFYAHHVFKDSSIVIGIVKSIEKEFGLEHLIDAFVLLKKRVKGLDIKLLIVGKGSLDTKIRTRVKDLQLEGDTVFTGYIPAIEAPFYQNMLSIAVFPSLNESFGVSVVEAMACEKPVIVSNVGGLPEVVEDGISGLVVPPANAERLAQVMEKLVKDEGLRKELGKQARLRVEKLYNWDNNLNSIIQIYDELIEGKVE